MGKFVIGLLGVFAVVNVAAKPIQFESTSKQTKMIELFTSQGCSSCPPAEKWLNTFVNSPKLWSEYIPMAFHVDYWDRLGWKDIYAKSEHTKRQYRYQEDGNVRVVYTPGFFANGQEWRRQWRSESMPQTRSAPGVLRLTVNEKVVKGTFNGSGKNKELYLNIALLGMGIKTNVQAGENDGRTLSQEFVVLGHTRVLSKNGEWRMDIPSASHQAPRNALVGWVSRMENQAPIQATGGWLRN